jgi:hypothetical protein
MGGCNVELLQHSLAPWVVFEGMSVSYAVMADASQRIRSSDAYRGALGQSRRSMSHVKLSPAPQTPAHHLGDIAVDIPAQLNPDTKKENDSLRLLQRSYVERKGLPFPLLWLLLMWSPLLPRAARVPGHGSGNAGRLRSLLGSLVFATIARSFDKILTEALSLESGGGGYVYFSLYSKSLGYEDWWMVGAQIQILLMSY